MSIDKKIIVYASAGAAIDAYMQQHFGDDWREKMEAERAAGPRPAETVAETIDGALVAGPVSVAHALQRGGVVYGVTAPAKFTFTTKENRSMEIQGLKHRPPTALLSKKNKLVSRPVARSAGMAELFPTSYEYGRRTDNPRGDICASIYESLFMTKGVDHHIGGVS